MFHRVDFDVWDPALRQSVRDSVIVDAATGDEAASEGRVKAEGKYPGMGMKVIGVHPCDAPEAPPAALEGDEAEPVDPMDADGDGEVSKAELLAEAARRGVAVDRRWGVARLREALA